MENRKRIENMTYIVNKSKLLYIDSSKFDADWHSTLHSHPFTELFYVIKGEGNFQFYDGSTIPVRQDDLLIINPNIIHTEASSTEDPLEYIVLGIDGVGVLAGNTFEEGYSIYNYEEFKHEILFYLRSLHKESEDYSLYSDLLMSNLLNVLLVNIVRRSEVDFQLQESDDKVNKDCLFIEHYLNTHYNEEITLDKLSELTFINKFYLSHIFKEHSGYSPIEYLLRKRVEAASKLLRTTDHSISEISGIVGFSNPSYFSQFFKRTTQLSPSSYRNQHTR